MQEQPSSLLQTSMFAEIAATIMAHTGEGIIVTDAQGKILLANPTFETVTGYTLEEVIGKKPNILQSGLHDHNFYRQMWSDLQEKGMWKGEIWNKRKNGELFVEWLTIKAVKNEQGETTHYVAIFSDITHHKRTMEQLTKLSNYDLLTGIPNRQLFTKRLEDLIETSRRHQQQFAVLFLDLDRFKYINDELGRHSGDLLLRKVANRLKKLLKTKDTIARIGGDEFVIILPNLKHLREAVRVAGDIVETLKAPFSLDGQEVYVSTSIGISFYPHDGQDVETLLRNADRAMQKAKDSGRNHFELYHEDLDGNGEVIVLENYLRKAIERQEFMLYYQPQVDTKTKKIYAVEALLRWKQPDLGFISPAQFIPLAEETGLIVPISEWVFKQACQDLKTLHQLDPHLKIGINISAVHFQQDDFVKKLSTITEQTNVHPRFIKLELTESTVMPNAHESIDKLVKLKQLGFKIAIDDFGTGFSSLSYLNKFPIDVLKIDQSFVRNLSTYKGDATIVTAIITMAHSLHLLVVAEGVETEKQYEFLAKQQCDFIQGYYIAKPMPLEELQVFLREWDAYINKKKQGGKDDGKNNTNCNSGDGT
jgi:diguanylate cyclase (GGDEF)-like protein/PAS domain S-box-containing protein